MPTPREELNRLRALAAQQVVPVVPQLTGRDELEQLRARAQASALAAQPVPADVVVPRAQLAYRPSGEALTPEQRRTQAPILTGIAEGDVGVLEPIATLATGALAEPIAGIGGLAKTITSGPEAGAETIEQIREGLTYQPRTEAGKESLRGLGEVVAPLAAGIEAADFSEEVFDLTGSPLAASVFATLPTAALEIAGIKGTSSLNRLRRIAKKEKGVIKEAKKAVVDSAPSVEKLKSASSDLYDSLGDSGVAVRIEPYNKFSSSLERKLISEGLDADLTPKATKVLARINAEKGKINSLNDMSKLRKFAQNAADAPDLSDARLGKIVINELDDFLASSNKSVFKNTMGATMAAGRHGSIGNKFKAARDLYGRAKRSELINEAIENASLAAGGMESGLKGEFTRLIKNKKNKKFFKPHELAAMKEVAVRPLGRNAARALGKLGISEGNVMGLVIGGGAWAGGIGPAGIAVPVVGEIAKRAAIKSAQSSVQRAKAAVASGKDANKIAATYLRTVPKAERSVDDLADLLLSVDLDDAKNIMGDKTGFVRDAVDIAKGSKFLRALEATTVIAPGSLEAVK